MRDGIRFAGAVAGTVLVGCVGVDPTPEWNRVREFSAERGSGAVRWELDRDDVEATRQELKTLLSDGLTRDEARRIALVNNRHLQAALEGIGVAKADLVQAGLPRNPRLSGALRLPLDPGDLESTLLFFLSDLWLLPARKEMERLRTDARLARVGIVVVATGTEALSAYDEVLFRMAERELAEATLKVHTDTAERMKVRYHSGLANDLDVQGAIAAALEARVELARAERDLRRARAHLEEFLGVPRELSDFQVAGVLEEAPDENWKSDEAVEFALRHRLELEAARSEVAALERRVSLERRRVFDDVRIGAEFEGDLKGENAGGPALDLELPAFDQNQAQIARAIHELRQSRQELAASELEARREVSELLAELDFHRTHVRIYKEGLETARRKAVEFADKFTDLMQLNFLFLLRAREDELESRRRYLRSLWHLRRAQADLHRALWAGRAGAGPDHAAGGRVLDARMRREEGRAGERDRPR